MVLATNPRIWIQDPALNREGVTWKDFCSDPEVMFQTALKYKQHLAFNLPFDQEMGVPAEAWTLGQFSHGGISAAPTPHQQPQDSLAGKRLPQLDAHGF